VDQVLVALLLVFTFFLGSFAARNADFLMDLATGRLIAHGEYTFGTDPFAYGTQDVFWVNHSWLFDLLVYGLWSVADDAGLIVFKALLLVALAAVLLRLRRPGQSAWVPVLCLGLAVLALSPRALMQSTCVSFLFLGITIYVLTQSGRIWLLPVLFALWVNLDAWFLLGPLTVTWYLLGSLGQQFAGQTPAQRPAKLGAVLLAGMAACLVNPYHFRAFTLPPELAYMAIQAGNVLPSWMVAAGETIQGLISGEQSLPRNQQGYRQLWLSPLSESWRTQVGLGNNIAGLAYFPLLLLGLTSFALPALRNARVFPWPRFLVWLFFAFLSLVQARLIPFFAVVAGPLMALNFHEYFTEIRSSPPPGRLRRPMILGRLATVLVFLGLIFLAWPGWLHGRIYPFDFHAVHRVAWKIDIDPSLRDAAGRLAELHERGVIHQGFAFSPDMGCYCAWFAPEVKGFIDYRYALFADRAKAFAQTKLALASHALENRADLQAPGLAKWRGLAEKFHIDFLVLTNFARGNNVTRFTAGFCWIESARWPWLYGDGRTLIFGWNESGKDSPLTHSTISLGKMAFGADADRAPGGGAPLPAGEPSVWESYLTGTSGPSLALDTAEQFQTFYKSFSQRLQGTYLQLRPWTALHGPIVLGVAAPASVSVPAVFNPPVYPSIFGPPAAPILAMRNVRRALADDPLDAPAYEVLAGVIDVEQRLQENVWAPERVPSFRQQMRQLQQIAAWKSYLILRPYDPRAHQTMAGIYFQQLQYLDVALEHLGLAVKHWDRQPRPTSPQAREQFEEQRKLLEGQYQGLEKEVRRRQAEYDLRTTGMPPLQKLQHAIGARPGQGLGLARKAIQALQQVRPSQLNQDESRVIAFQQISLLLLLGEVRAVNENLESLRALGSAYYRTEVYCAAVAGEYDRADAVMATLLKGMELGRSLPVLALFPMKLAPNLSFMGPLAQGPLDNWGKIGDLLYQAAEWHLVRGILAVEHGNTLLARQSFQKVLDLVGTTFPERPIAEHYLKLLRENQK